MKSSFHIFAIGLLFALAARADVTYYVSTTGDGSNPTSGVLSEAYAHPQTAIDAGVAARASESERVTVKVAAGTYTVKNATADQSVITITNGNVTVEALSPREVFINAEKWAKSDSRLSTKTINRAVRVASGLSNVRLVGLVFQGGSAVEKSAYKSTNVASCALAEAGFFENCEFWGYHYYYLDAIAFRGTAVASNCLFTAYETGQSGTTVGGEYTLAVSGSAELHDSIVEKTFWDMERQKNIYPVSLSGSCVVSNCVIRNNIFSSPCSILSKGFGYHTGVGTVVMSGGTLVDTVVSNNLAYGNSGGVYVTSDSAVIKNCVLWGNRATGDYNNLRIASGVSPTITGTKVQDADESISGVTSFEPWQEFCTSNSIAVGKAPFKVRFRNRTNDASAVWDFGDGSATVTGATPEHTYTAVGAYTVKMTLGGTTYERTNYIAALGDTVCVSKTGTATPPYDTYEKGLVHPQDALDLLPPNPGVTIAIDDGKYTVRKANDTSVLMICKDGMKLKARNGNGHVWIDSQRTCSGRAYVRRNVSIGGGVSDVLVDGLVMTNGWTSYNVDGGCSCALVGSGVFTNCTFDLYCFQWSIAVIAGGVANLTHCRLGAANGTKKNIWSHRDYGISLGGSSVLDTCNLFGVDLRTDSNYSNPYVNISSANAVMRNCLVTNFKGGNGSNGRGAIYASAGTIENCTIVNNSVTGGKGGGAYLASTDVVFRNNIVWGNTAPNVESGHNIYATDYSGCTYSAATEIDATAENHNVKLTQDEDPGFTDAANGDYSLKVKTLMTGAGLVRGWMEDAQDFAGQPRLFDETVSMGCYEPQGRSTDLIGDFSVSGTSFGAPPLTVSFSSTITGGTGSYLYKWDFGDGTVTDFISDGAPTHTYDSVKAYDVSLVVKCGENTTDFGTKTNLVIAVGDTCYLRPDQDGEPPYDTWAKATSNIEAAVALKPKAILATNGTYYIQSVADANGILLNRAMTLKSVEGPTKTVLSRTAAAAYGSRVQFHLVTLTHADAVVDGFSLIRAVPSAISASAGLVSNCIVTNSNKTYMEALVSLSGTAVLSNCVVDATGQAFGDYAAYGSAIRMSGSSQVVNCEVKNISYSGGDGNGRGGVWAWDKTRILNCYVHDICYSRGSGGAGYGNAGIYATGNATVDCCTVTRCWANNNPGGGINAASSATVRNCLAYGNTGGGTKRGTGDSALDIPGGTTPTVFANNLVGASGDGVLPATATACLPLGTDPLLATNGPAYRITRASPCWNAGRKLEWCPRRGRAVDIEGNERVRGTVDIGCYECPSAPGLIFFVR